MEEKHSQIQTPTPQEKPTTSLEQGEGEGEEFYDHEQHKHTLLLISSSQIQTLLPNPSSLFNHLLTSLPFYFPTLTCPQRSQFPLNAPNSSSSLILMPSFPSSNYSPFPYLGVKILTSFPLNPLLNLPTIHAAYLLFSSNTGRPLANIDGAQLTLHRTSVICALAAHFLARRDAHTLVMVGAGELAPYLIKAHLFATPSLIKVIIWNRTVDRAEALARRLRGELADGIEVHVGEELEKEVREGDVVCCATSSERVLVEGRVLKKGVHLDLVGSFRKTMRECDDDAIGRGKGKVFVDCEAAFEEAGEIVGAVERGVVRREEVGFLVELLEGKREGRKSEEEVTVFKAVGNGMVDLLSAQLVYEKMAALC